MAEQRPVAARRAGFPNLSLVLPRGGGTQVFTSRSSGEVMLTVSVSSLAGGGAKQRQDDDVVQDMMMKGWKPTY